MRRWAMSVWLCGWMLGCGGNSAPELDDLDCILEGGQCPATTCCGIDEQQLMQCYLERPDGAIYLCDGSNCTQTALDMACEECGHCSP